MKKNISKKQLKGILALHGISGQTNNINTIKMHYRISSNVSIYFMDNHSTVIINNGITDLYSRYNFNEAATATLKILSSIKA